MIDTTPLKAQTHVDQSVVEERGGGVQSGCLICRAKGGMNTKLHGVANGDGRPIRV